MPMGIGNAPVGTLSTGRVQISEPVAILQSTPYAWRFVSTTTRSVASSFGMHARRPLSSMATKFEFFQKRHTSLKRFSLEDKRRPGSGRGLRTLPFDPTL